MSGAFPHIARTRDCFALLGLALRASANPSGHGPGSLRVEPRLLVLVEPGRTVDARLLRRRLLLARGDLLGLDLLRLPKQGVLLPFALGPVFHRDIEVIRNHLLPAGGGVLKPVVRDLEVRELRHLGELLLPQLGIAHVDRVLHAAASDQLAVEPDVGVGVHVRVARFEVRDDACIPLGDGIRFLDAFVVHSGLDLAPIRLHHVDDVGQDGAIVDTQVGQHDPVEVDIRLLQPTNQRAVVEAVKPGVRVDTHDAHHSVLLAFLRPVTRPLPQRLHHSPLGYPEAVPALARVVLGVLHPHLLALVPSADVGLVDVLDPGGARGAAQRPAVPLVGVPELVDLTLPALMPVALPGKVVILRLLFHRLHFQCQGCSLDHTQSGGAGAASAARGDRGRGPRQRGGRSHSEGRRLRGGGCAGRLAHGGGAQEASRRALLRGDCAAAGGDEAAGEALGRTDGEGGDHARWEQCRRGRSAFLRGHGHLVSGAEGVRKYKGARARASTA
mmetsp:Transcript_30547/g.87631  ORF Transcript_30547/g.87631 Transcript_30547/m.87631 type:complete len:500 (-) Transcript_30547:3-1502(-)